jgi:hypothetical protein
MSIQENTSASDQLWFDSVADGEVDEFLAEGPGVIVDAASANQSLTKKNILGKHVTPGGVVSSFKSVRALNDDLERGRIQREIETAKLDVLAKRKVALEAREKADREVAKRRELEAHIDKLKGDIQRLQGHTENVGLVRKHEKELAQAEYQLGEQNTFVERETKLMYHAEKEADYADMLLEKYADADERLLQHVKEEYEEDKVVANFRTAREEKAANRFKERQVKKTERLARQAEAQNQLAANQVQVTKIQHAIAKDNYSKLLQDQKTTLKEVTRLHAEEHTDRARALLKLKKSTERANAAMKGKNAKKKAAEKKLEEQQKKEFDAILADGRNPYEVFRREKQEKKFKADKQALIDKEKKNKDEIAMKMIKEEVHFVKQDKVIREHAKFADIYRDSLGRHVVEERNQNYVKSMTKTGEDFVDPTGRMFRIEGSTVTAIPDNSLGIGKLAVQRPDIIQKKASQSTMKGVTFNELHSYVKGAKGGDSDSDDGIPNAGHDQFEDLLGKEERPGEGLPINMSASPRDYAASLPQASAAHADGQSSSFSGGSVTLNKGEPHKARALTNLEQQYMEKAKERHKQNIVGTQVVWGKEFQGAAFISKPAKIVFKDFDVGKKMKIRFSLTNVSYTFNSFKLLDLDDEIKDFFEITYTKPGRMSAGTSCSILIEFEPKLNQDIVSVLPILSATGKISVPLECYTKKVVPSLSTSLLDMSTVVLGDEIKCVCKLINDGALPTKFHIEELTALDEFQFDAETNELLVEPVKDSLPELLKYVSEGDMDAYSSTVVSFTFRPLQPGKLHRVLRVTFDGSDVEAVLTATALSLRVPIYVEKRLIDLRTCVYGKMYRAAVNVRNRGTVALKMSSSVPKELSDALGMFPPMGFVQAAEKSTGESGLFAMQMKFRPTPETIERCQKFCTDESDPTIMVVPIRLLVPDQTLPVIFRLKAKLSTSDILFKPSSIDFGPCFTEQSVSVPLEITNQCALPQKFGFVHLPRELSVPEDDGFGTLLPGETIVRNVVFSPIAAVSEKYTLKMQTFLGREFKIPCVGAGVEPVLSLDYNVLKLAACPMGERVVQSIMVSNASRISQIFEFCPPDVRISGITICPCVQVLEPGCKVRVEITFKPDSITIGPDGNDASIVKEQQKTVEEVIAESDVSSAASSRASSKSGGKKGKGKPKTPGKKSVPEPGKEEEKTEATPDTATNNVVPFQMPPTHEGLVSWSDAVTGGSETWSRHGTWKIPCYTKPNRENSKVDPKDPLVCVEVHTVTIEKVFTAEVPSDVVLRFPASHSSRLDFGQMAVGQVEVAPVIVSNLNPKGTWLKLKQPPNILGPFSIVNALRPLHEFGDLHGKGSRSLFIQFRPEAQLKYSERISFETQYGSASILLVGQGVEPVLEMMPSDGKLDLGQVLAGDSSTQVVTLKNLSVFPMTYNTKSRGDVPTNYNGTAVFSCVPETAVIQPGETQEMKVTIRPDHELPEPYKCQIVVRIPTADEKKAVEKTLYLTGRCWQRQLYARPTQSADEPKSGSKDTIDDIFSVPPELGVELQLPEEHVQHGTKPRDHFVRLVFPKPKPGDEQLVKEISVGSTMINEPGKSGSAGSFEIGPPSESDGASYFSFEPNKGALGAGNSVTVKVKFTPPVLDEVEKDDPCVTIGRWVVLDFPCVLKGGYVPAGVAGEETVKITVSGFVVGKQ